MSKTDTIADSLTIIRNASSIRKDDVVLPFSKIVETICKILKSEGYIEDVTSMELDNSKKLKVYLKYLGKKSAITALKKVSRSGRRYYVPKDKIPLVLRGYGISIISTSSGVLTGKQAKEKGLGGEVLAKVW
jgi:small subunit ribosomal protein S8